MLDGSPDVFPYKVPSGVLLVYLLLCICQPRVRRCRGEPPVVGTKKVNACVHTRLNYKEEIPCTTVIEEEQDSYSRVRKK